MSDHEEQAPPEPQEPSTDAAPDQPVTPPTPPLPGDQRAKGMQERQESK